MRSCCHFLVTFPVLVYLLFSIGAISAANYQPTDVILLNCGASASQALDSEGRQWTTDVGSKFASAAANSVAATAATQDPSVSQIPFMTARIFRTPFTYSFPVAAGRKFVRLYFYPASYANLDASNAIFSVSSGHFTLLNNFSAALTTEALNYYYVVKEYSINVLESTLNVTFTPSSNASNSYAFVNGIEVVSMPDIYDTADGSSSFVGQNYPFYVDNTTALETAYRLNVGGSNILGSNDTGMFRSWGDDLPYLAGGSQGSPVILDQGLNITYPPSMPSYVAPVDVYATARTMTPDNTVNVNFNLSWMFSVDSGFNYLVRLHFCEPFVEIFKVNQRVFDIYINNQTAMPGADVITWAKSNGVPVYKDYVTFMPLGSPQQDLWLALHPDVSTKPEYYNAILNGVEIFKINSSNGNLAGLTPVPLPKQDIINPPSARPASKSRGSNSNHKGVIIGGGVGGVLTTALLIGLCIFVASHRRRLGKDSRSSDGPSGWLPISRYGNSQSVGSAKTHTTGSYASSLPSNLSRHFSFAEIKAATKNFDENLVLGVGGFGKVYKGEIDGGVTKVAIKRGNPLSEQGVHEFQTEIEMLSKLRHRHLVSLIGYCEDNCEMILVYDYMAHGTLREHLYNAQKPPLPWRQRLEICIGAARGLHYLHTGAKHNIIHRDVKTTNILLDEKWVAKVSDFGLSKTGPSLNHTHVSTVVKGSFGYLDPEYFRRQQLTDKSDVYSFGVVLFEIICARPALNPTLPKEQVSLAEWALHCQKKGILDQIIDPYLKGKIAPECFRKFAETAMKCLCDQGIERPSMGDVLWNLEFALQLQESAEESGMALGGADIEGSFRISCEGGKKDPNASPGFNGVVTDSQSSGITMSLGGQSLGSEDSDGLTPSAVFSQIMNPKGR